MLAETKDCEDGGDVYSSTVCKIFNFTTPIDKDERSEPMEEGDDREHTTILIVTKSPKFDELNFLSITLLEGEDCESYLPAQTAEFERGVIHDSCDDKDFVKNFSKENYGTEPTSIEVLDCSDGKLKLESLDLSGGSIMSGPEFVTLVFSHSEHGKGEVFVDKYGGDDYSPNGEITTKLPEPYKSIFSTY